jgi:GDPmannose 4,6-dehydratase
MRQRTALIIGVSGQDGAYLAELLIGRGFELHGTSRDKELSSYSNLRQLGVYDSVKVHSVVLGDFRSLATVLNNVRPGYIYNIAAQSSVGL